jgi:hypothetical protein
VSSCRTFSSCSETSDCEPAPPMSGTAHAATTRRGKKQKRDKTEKFRWWNQKLFFNMCHEFNLYMQGLFVNLFIYSSNYFDVIVAYLKPVVARF